MIRIVKGTFGWFDGRFVRPITSADGPVSLDARLEERLVGEGVAEYAEGAAPAPAATEPAASEPAAGVDDEGRSDLSALSKAELVEIAKRDGIKVSGLTKAQLIDAIEGEEPPTFGE